MNCNAFKSWIALYVEGDLSEADRKRVESHVRICSSCWDLVHDLRESQSMFKSLRAETVNATELAEVRERVFNEVRTLQPAPGWVVAMHRMFFAGFRFRNAVAGVVLVFLVSGALWHSLMHQPTVFEAPMKVATPEAREVLKPAEAAISAAVRRPIPYKRSAPSATLEEEVLEIPSIPLIAEPVEESSQALVVPMKFLTDDPNIIIYWLPADKGD